MQRSFAMVGHGVDLRPGRSPPVKEHFLAVLGSVGGERVHHALPVVPPALVQQGQVSIPPGNAPAPAPHKPKSASKPCRKHWIALTSSSRASITLSRHWPLRSNLKSAECLKSRQRMIDFQAVPQVGGGKHLGRLSSSSIFGREGVHNVSG